MKNLSILASFLIATVQSKDNVTECPPADAQCGEFPSFVYAYESSTPCWGKDKDGYWDCSWYEKDTKCKKGEVNKLKKCHYPKIEFACPKKGDDCLQGDIVYSADGFGPSCWKKSLFGWNCGYASPCDNNEDIYDIYEHCGIEKGKESEY